MKDLVKKSVMLLGLCACLMGMSGCLEETIQDAGSSSFTSGAVPIPAGTDYDKTTRNLPVAPGHVTVRGLDGCIRPH